VVLAGEITSISADRISGWVAGSFAEANGVFSPDRWMFDLPDQDLLYPGDVVHYRIEAWDELAGVYRKSNLPADLTGYGDFTEVTAYDPSFIFHALPHLTDASGAQPSILFWNDNANRGGRDEWHTAFRYAGYAGSDYDIFYTNGPTSEVGNGLGGRATVDQIAGYDIIVYTSGDQGNGTITPAEFELDPGDDLGLLTAWLDSGDKSLFATGAGLISDLWVNGGPEGQAFVSDWFGVTWLPGDVRSQVGGNAAPTVYSVPENSIFLENDTWIAYGGCPKIETFDAVAVTHAEKLAVFEDDASGLSAASRVQAANGSEVISLPYDLMHIRTPRTAAKAGSPAPAGARDSVLRQVLLAFGSSPLSDPAATGDSPMRFAASAYPNPFNPATRIDYSLPRDGHLRLRIYDVRGQRVRTLVDERRAAGSGHVMWDGSDDGGRSVATGVYFYEALTGGETKVQKLVLLK